MVCSHPLKHYLCAVWFISSDRMVLIGFLAGICFFLFLCFLSFCMYSSSNIYLSSTVYSQCIILLLLVTNSFFFTCFFVITIITIWEDGARVMVIRSEVLASQLDVQPICNDTKQINVLVTFIHSLKVTDVLIRKRIQVEKYIRYQAISHPTAGKTKSQKDLIFCCTSWKHS